MGHPESAPTVSDMTESLVVTAPTFPGCGAKEILEVVSGLTARTRDMGGKFLAGIQLMLGVEVSVFTMEIQKARTESVRRMTKQAQETEPTLS